MHVAPRETPAIKRNRVVHRPGPHWIVEASDPELDRPEYADGTPGSS